nr:AAA family ATPase [Synergistales bacterium]
KVHSHDADGHSVDLSPQHLLGGVDERLFSRIFCLGLEDLWEGEDRILDEDNLRSRIFAASSGLGHFSISRALSGLKDDLSEISKWTSARRNTLLDEIEHKLGEIQREISSLGDLSSMYVRLREERKALEDHIGSLRENIEVSRFRKIEMKRLDNLIEPYQSLKRTEEMMGELGRAEKFPSSGRERYQALKDRFLTTRVELNRLLKTEEDLRNRIHRVQLSDKILQDRGRVEEMAEHKVRLEEKLEKLADLRSEKRDLDRELFSLLDIISRGWDLDDLEKADISMASAGEAAEFLKDLNGLNERKNRITGVLEEIELSHNEVFQEYHACAERLSSLEEDQDPEIHRVSLEKALQSLDALRYLSREHDLVEERILMEQTRLNDLSGDLERSLEGMERPWVMPLSLPSAALILSAVLSLQFLPVDSIDLLLPPVIPVAAFGISLGLLALRMYQGMKRRDFMKEREGRDSALRQEIEGSRKELALLFQRSEELKSQLAFHCNNSGISM